MSFISLLRFSTDSAAFIVDQIFVVGLAGFKADFVARAVFTLNGKALRTRLSDLINILGVFELVEAGFTASLAGADINCYGSDCHYGGYDKRKGMLKVCIHTKGFLNELGSGYATICGEG